MAETTNITKAPAPAKPAPAKPAASAKAPVKAGKDRRGFLYVMSTTCTHLGCTPNWWDKEQKFKCPCHGSGFKITGVNFEGPAPRPLERWAIAIADDGQIIVDKSKKFQKELGQWSDPESFIK